MNVSGFLSEQMMTSCCHFLQQKSSGAARKKEEGGPEAHFKKSKAIILEFWILVCIKLKGPKNFLAALKIVSFLQLSAEKKDTIFEAARKNVVPSYFVLFYGLIVKVRPLVSFILGFIWVHGWECWLFWAGYLLLRWIVVWSYDGLHNRKKDIS